jgi:hypothetical protein
MDHDAVADSRLSVLIRAGGEAGAMRVPANHLAIAKASGDTTKME